MFLLFVLFDLSINPKLELFWLWLNYLSLELMDTQRLEELSTGMEVTVGGMDAAVEPIGIYLRRVTEVAVLNVWIH